ncbi:unnamed protein product [Chondrus crispus]|uniref:Uncharacterized protein n=1 Tax=Chondrus crispus TaxID=2769 RepID=R7QES5_CHOCR|nr:unnamed protein product [Chondrus crispus]CDF36987.1 unnamed protein product [Chondrus crispus]|eukprot:XP_005716806.1 unnamed protein product [Chondrus crispus]
MSPGSGGPARRSFGGTGSGLARRRGTAHVVVESKQGRWGGGGGAREAAGRTFGKCGAVQRRWWADQRKADDVNLRIMGCALNTCVTCIHVSKWAKYCKALKKGPGQGLS